jgi:hypothetical protein
MTFEEIRTTVKDRYHHDENDRVALQFSGFIHDLPLIAICIVLVSAVVRGTANVDQLSDFTRYSKGFIAAIAYNMENSGLWKEGRYDASDWSPNGNPLPRNEHEEEQFWEHVDIGEGSYSTSRAQLPAADPSAIFWEDKASERARL